MMTGKEYLSSLAGIKPDQKKADRVASLYTSNLPQIIQKIISRAKEPVFLDDGSRVLAYDEIVDAEKDLHVAFKERGMIPLVDCGENDFIVYHFEDRIWSKFNIIDETVFKKKKGLEELLK